LLCFGEYDKVNFYPFFFYKDLLNIIFLILFLVFILQRPYLLGDPEIFVEANPLIRPVHIIPEWYFLFAYAILRSIPNKVLGVFFLLMCLLVFFLFGLINHKLRCLEERNFFFVRSFVICCIFLSWLGQCVLESPFIGLGLRISLIYIFIVILILLNYVAPEILLN
jgi:ubiquinol-cytochrome c reductase cytochrome b subunit